VVQPRVAQVSLFPAVFGAGGGAGAKALLEADDGDACGCRFLLGGIVMALPMLPHLERWGKPLIPLAGSDSSGTTVSSPPWSRCLGRLESPEGHNGVQIGGRLERGLPGHNVRCRRCFLVDIFRLVWSRHLSSES
jgi:hypothetical protein